MSKFHTELVFALQPSGPGRCTINNGGCWHEERDGHAFSACVVSGFSCALLHF